MKNNKGITLLALVIIVIILAIIISVTVSTSITISGTAMFENQKTYLLLIQGKCKMAKDKQVIGDITEEELYGEIVNEGEYAGWYRLSQEELIEMGIKDAKEDELYYVNYSDIDVANGNGIEYKGVTYYKLSEMKEQS